MFEFRRPAVWDVLKRVGRVDGEAEQDHVGVRVGQRTQPMMSVVVMMVVVVMMRMLVVIVLVMVILLEV